MSTLSRPGKKIIDKRFNNVEGKIFLMIRTELNNVKRRNRSLILIKLNNEI